MAKFYLIFKDDMIAAVSIADWCLGFVDVKG